jgi:lysophospholipase L1-like esterase
MFVSVALSALVLAQPANPVKPFEFKDGDRIVWLGNTLVEREQRYGYWETALIAANADKNITLRNLGWSGDTVFGDARAGFEDAAKGFERLVSLALILKPSVIFVSYGTNEAFEGKDGLPKFEKGLEKLLDALKPANARIVLFTPLPFFEGNTRPKASDRNKSVEMYADAIRVVARNRNLYLADAHDILGDVTRNAGGSRSPASGPEASELTVNGMHLTEKGYRAAAGNFLASLGQTKAGTDEKALDSLREAVVAKNELFFYRWRPQNETYLFGFRKHEQGKNAKEVAEFDPLVSKAEDEIAKIRKTLK